MGASPVFASEVGWIALGLLCVPLLIAVNAFFVAAEFALVLVRRTRVEEMLRQGRRGAAVVERAVARIDRTLAAVQVGVTAAGIALGALGEPAFVRLLEPALAQLPGLPPELRRALGFGVTFLVLTFLCIVFGELVPKDLALRKPDAAALWLAAPMLIFTRISRPFVALVLAAKNAFLRLLGVEPASGEQAALSVVELSLLVEDSQDSGVLNPTQAEVLQKTFRLSGKRVKDCLLPREKVVALELRTPEARVLEVVRETAHTRMPVYEGELDNIVGIVNTKNLFYQFSLHGRVVIADAMYPALFLEPEEDVAQALQVFRKARRPMAVVRDAAGRVHGILTLEDVLEEIVGEIEDEHDVPTPTAARKGSM